MRKWQCVAVSQLFLTMNISGNMTRETEFGKPSQEALDLPFYNLLPKDPVELLKFRIYVRQRCLEDVQFREMIDQMCSQDCAFFIQVFGFFHETRETGQHVGKFPVRLYADQVDLIAWFMGAIGKTDIIVEKTRGIGLSYLLVCVYLWLWKYRGESLDLALISKQESTLDIPRRPSSLLGKLDLLFENLPMWMQVDNDGRSILHRTLKDHKFVNLQNGNAIFGFVPTSDKLRGGRYYAVGIDEGAFLDNNDQRFLAATQEVTFCRLWVSTHNGTATLFYRLTRDEKSDLLRIATWWWNNEHCRKGLYKVEKGKVLNLDDHMIPDYKYSFEHAGKLRSWWLDRAFRRAGANPQLIFEELYGIAALDGRKMIRKSILDIMDESSIQPRFRGYVTEKGEFIEDADGQWFLWTDPDQLHSTYAVGCDSALGVPGGDFAGFCAIDEKTGATVMTAMLPNVNGLEFARLAVGACKLLTGARGAGQAKLVYESTGINTTFAQELKRLKYPSVFQGPNKKPGLPNKDKGESWLLEFGRAVQDSEAVVFDERIREDLGNFEYDSNKFELVFAGADGHGDLGIATGLAWQGAKRSRQRLVKSEKDEYNRIQTLGPEAEPAFQEKKRGNHLWSSQFNRRRRTCYGY